MKWTGLNELRESFLSFFEQKAHLRQPSAPLVPRDDASLLLINSGMAPLKNYFLGITTPPAKRLTTCQKCIRTPDIEEVGKTSRHGTYFEMLGNFSFGDYFKKEATQWAWEYLVDVLEIPVEKLWITIYEDDQEAYDIWTKDRGVSKDKMVRLGKEHNFWEIGSGPCGPCSEIHYDRGEKYGCDAKECGIGKCECDRYMEIWNLVFTQYNSDGEGNYTPLEHPNIDTGMGLERLACIMQDVDNLFEVDTVKNIMEKVCEIANVKYKDNEKADVSLRVISDHMRSTMFMIGDGVLPSNEGRGYVLRRLIRRGARHGHLLGIKGTFMHTLCEVVARENQSVYPELTERLDYIKKAIKAEEDAFAKTISQGMSMLLDIIERFAAATNINPIINGEELFRLYDTFGFPVDLTREIAEDHGISIDENGFKEHMEQQRARAREAHNQQGGISWEEDVLTSIEINGEFLGYTALETDAKVVAIVKDGALIDGILEGEEAIIVLDKTTFYAESGGQVGDTGTIETGNGIFEVYDCQKSPTGHIIHIGKLVKGKLNVANEVMAKVDKHRRYAILRNHTAVHLLQAELRKLLGEHIHQAGSYVSDEFARFDFTHFNPVSTKELRQIEKNVNRHIEESIPLTTEEMPIEEAKKKGALALFGDKYSDIVRVCAIGDVSTELCGGTHVKNTAQIGLFKIVGESSVAAGVRRIEVITGNGILKMLGNRDKAIAEVGAVLKVNSIEDLLPRAKAVNEQTIQLEKKLAELEQKAAREQTENFGKNLISIGSVKLAAIAIAGNIEPLQGQADQLKDSHPNLVGVMIAMGESSATALVFAGKEAVKAGVHSGNIIKELTAIAGGKGGGRPDNAKGGMPDITKVDEALSAAQGIVAAQLGL